MGFLPSIKAKEQGLLKLPQTELHLSALVFFLPLFIQLLFLLQVHKKKKKNSAFPPSFRVRVSFQPRCKNVFVVVLLPRKNDFVVRTRPQERFCGVLSPTRMIFVRSNQAPQGLLTSRTTNPYLLTLT